MQSVLFKGAARETSTARPLLTDDISAAAKFVHNAFRSVHIIACMLRENGDDKGNADVVDNEESHAAERRDTPEEVAEQHEMQSPAKVAPERHIKERKKAD